MQSWRSTPDRDKIGKADRAKAIRGEARMVQKVTKDLTEDLIAEIAELKLTNDDFTNLREEHQQQQIQRDQDLLESRTDLEKVTTKYFGVLLCRLKECISGLQNLLAENGAQVAQLAENGAQVAQLAENGAQVAQLAENGAQVAQLA